MQRSVNLTLTQLYPPPTTTTTNHFLTQGWLICVSVLDEATVCLPVQLLGQGRHAKSSTNGIKMWRDVNWAQRQRSSCCCCTSQRRRFRHLASKIKCTCSPIHLHTHKQTDTHAQLQLCYFWTDRRRAVCDAAGDGKCKNFFCKLAQIVKYKCPSSQQKQQCWTTAVVTSICAITQFSLVFWCFFMYWKIFTRNFGSMLIQ